MGKLRLALFSPLNPMKSGISDYSEELLPALGDRAEIDIVIGPYAPSNNSIRQRFEIIHPDEFLRRQPLYDCVVYQLGNSLEYHAYMIPCMSQAPGIVVLHDYSLSFLVLGLTLLRGDFGALKSALTAQFGERAGSVARRLLFGLEDQYTLSLAAPIVQMSRGVIVHSEFAANWLRSEFPAIPARVIPHGVTIQPLFPPDPGVRVRYGLKTDDLVIASVSTLAYNKRLGTVLSSLPELRSRFPNIRLLIVSGGRMSVDVRRMITTLGIQDIVFQTGWVPWDEYRQLIRASDLVVNLRYPTAGETSGSALRSMEAGRPLIVSDHGSFRELPDDASIKIPVDEQPEQGREQDAFVRAVQTILGDARKRNAMGHAARTFVCKNLSIQDAAERYLSFIREVMSDPRPRPTAAFPQTRANLFQRTLISFVYRVFRMGYVYRHYGARDIWQRLTIARGSGAASANRH